MIAAILALAAVGSVNLTPNQWYRGERAPLARSLFVKLPPGAVTPQGWLRTQLMLESKGYTGNLTQLSRFLQADTNAWLNRDGQGKHGWEETPYWLRGYGDLGYVLHDRTVIRAAKKWIDAVIEDQRPDGYFGPESNLTADNGKPDLWPNMLMLFSLRSYYEFSHDARVTTLMKRYFKWELALPDAKFLHDSWQHERGGDNLSSVLWLYDRTGGRYLLALADKIHRCTADWEHGVKDWHGVDFAQCFREPAEFYEVTKSPKDLHATLADYHEMYSIYGQVPGGMYGADEVARPGFTSARQCTETCAMVEMMMSSEMLMRETASSSWADHAENVAFNDFPAAMTANLRGLRYLTAPNLVEADPGNKSPDILNQGAMVSYNPYDYRCCQHNSGMGWPYFTESLWAAAPANGLAAVMYSPCEVTANVGKSTTVTIDEITRYPFRGQIDLRIHLRRRDRFPLWLRIPGWCNHFSIAVNGTVAKQEKFGGFRVLDRTWKGGDVVNVRFAQSVRVKKWPDGSVSIYRGPLGYALKIAENYKRYGGTKQWPAYEVLPKSPWNYGLDASSMDDLTVHRMPLAYDAQPFEQSNAPVQMSIKAFQIPQWRLDRMGMVGLIQQCPALTSRVATTVDLIPMGCERLRISAFPTVTRNPHLGHVWVRPRRPIRASASHCWVDDTVDAPSINLAPNSSDDETIPRFTWWGRLGTQEWFEYHFARPTSASSASVYWFDDQASGGGCRAPQSWLLQYRAPTGWKDVSSPSTYTTAINRFDVVDFRTVTASRFRILVQLKNGFSGGILAWNLK